MHSNSSVISRVPAPDSIAKAIACQPSPLRRAISKFLLISSISTLGAVHTFAETTEPLESNATSSAVETKADGENVVTAETAGTAPSNGNSDNPKSTLTTVGAINLDKIVVTGQKLNRSLLETTSSITVIDSSEVENRGDSSVLDTLQRSANASSGHDGRFSLRGINSRGVENTTFARPNIGVYVDGVALNRTALQTGSYNLFDIEQVEIMRGAQSTSLGRNSIGGGVVINTKNPEFYDEYRVKLSGGQNEYEGPNGGETYYEVGAVANKVLSESLALRLTGQTRQDPGFIYNTTRDEHDWARTNFTKLAAKLRYQPVDLSQLTLDFKVSYNDSDLGATDSVEYEGQEKMTSTANDEDFKRSKVYLYSIASNYELDSSDTLTYTFGYQDSDQTTNRDGDRTDDDDYLFFRPGSGSTQTHELRYQFNRFENLRGFVGLFTGRFRDQAQSIARGIPIPVSAVVPGAPGNVRLNTLVERDITEDNYAVFGEFDYDFAERWTLTTGLRYDYETNNLITDFEAQSADLIVCSDEILPQLPESCTPGVPVLLALEAAGIIPTVGSGLEADYDALLPKIALAYQFDNSRVFASYNRGYRAGGATESPNGETIPYDPEYTDNFETGIRSQLFDQSLTLSANLFYTYWRDQQVTVVREDSNGTQFAVTENAASSELYGAEIETRWSPVADLQLDLNLGYVHTEFLDYVNGRNDRTGNEFPQAPNFTGSTGFTYAPSKGLLKGMLLNTYVVHESSNFARPDNLDVHRSEGFTLLNAKVGYETDRGSLFVVGQNLTDEVYTVFRNEARATAGRDEAGEFVAYGGRRRIGLDLNLYF